MAKSGRFSNIFEDAVAVRRLIGVHDENMRLLEELFGVEIFIRDAEISVKGEKDAAEAAFGVISHLYEMAVERYQPDLKDVEQIAKFSGSKLRTKMSDVYKYAIKVPANGRTISPKSLAQLEYVKSISAHDMIFSIGPAGTGKTYLAMAMAVNSLLNKKFDRIILTRPAVEAGEKLGFLPGDLQEKVNPYLRPLYDALHDMMDTEQVRRLLSQGVIEVAPLAFMRGRTLNSSFVILDEAQNCTREQMKMFLTRMGFDSKYVITGDVTQIDLPSHINSGLLDVMGILKKIKGIHFQYFTEVDVVRHRLVQSIVRAYEKIGVTRNEKKHR